MPDLPPWLNINPLEPTRGFLQGFGQGAQVGTSRRVGEQQAAEFAQVQAFREAQAAAQQAQAAIANQLARERLEQQQAEFTANIRLKEQEAEREAAEAAANALDDMKFTQAIKDGMPQWQAAALYPRVYRRPGFGTAMSAGMRAQQASIPPTFVPAGGYAAPGDVPNTFQGWPDELVGLKGAPAHWRTGSGQVRFPPRSATPEEGDITEAKRLEYGTLKSEIASINRQLLQMSRNDPRREEKEKEKADLEAKMKAILAGTATPTAPATRVKDYWYDPKTRSFKLKP